MICSLLLFVSGLIVLPAGCRRDRSTAWPVATGLVAATALRLDFHKPPQAPYYRPFVCYTYNVGGIPRANTKINYSDSSRTFHKEDGLAWLNENYPVGKQISVFYNPDDPDMSVLERGAKELIWIAIAMTSMSSLCFVAAWILRRRTRQRLSAPAGPLADS